ncbi:MAG: hypothetical protein H8E14_08245 [Candidatus Marinimicrobia bacterium]|nr:hypothetical protein [Candidatus Neomarinimicrobiota bacterium]
MFPRKSFLLLFLLQLLCGQSINNAIGLGAPRDLTSASAFGVGSSGLIPSFSEGIALENPVTWSNGKFALLSSGFRAERINQENTGIVNGISDLNRVQLILPIKNIYALGISVVPLTNSNYWLKNESTSFPLEDDTLSILQEIKGSGGINALRVAFGFPLTDHEKNAFTLQILFGSSRHNSILDIDGTKYIYNRHDNYSGVFLKYYIYTNRFNISNLPISLYGSIGLTLQSLALKSNQYHLFEDLNNNGNYDYLFDYPYMTDTETKTEKLYSHIQKPFSVELGYDMELKSQFHILGEISGQTFNNELHYHLSPLAGSAYNSIIHFNLGAIKFARTIPRVWYQNFHYRMGFYFDSKDLQLYQDNLIETGLSLGIGFKFGVTNNQIDLAYSYAKRQGPLTTSNEIIERFKIQMTLGDIWFVKRRTR